MYATRAFGFVFAVGLLVFAGPASGQTPAGTAFTFQGKLQYQGAPANGDFDFRFILYNDCIGGQQEGDIIYKDAVPVEDGIFTVDLDFGGAVFVGDLRCLEVAVRVAGPGPYFTLSPRHELRPTPYALTPVNPAFPVITGNGTTNRISKFDGTQSIDDSDIYNVGGYVGIGVPIPTEALDVAGNIHASGTISSGSSITIDGTTDTISATSGTISFDDENLETMGKVGIGTTPSSELDVGGTITTDDLTVNGAVSGAGFNGWDTDESNDVTMATPLSGDVTGTVGATVVGDDTHSHGDSTVSDNISINNTRLYAPAGAGYVGIRRTDPQYDLDLSGDIRATGTMYGTVTNADDAHTVDGYHAGNSSGQVAVSNGIVCTDLNADMVDGQHASAFLTQSQGDVLYVNEGQLNSVTTWMIAADAVTKVHETGSMYGCSVDNNVDVDMPNMTLTFTPASDCYLVISFFIGLVRGDSNPHHVRFLLVKDGILLGSARCNALGSYSCSASMQRIVAAGGISTTIKVQWAEYSAGRAVIPGPTHGYNRVLTVIELKR